jgi:D-alanine--poly(phosphoribitol) ligase subunit 2
MKLSQEEISATIKEYILNRFVKANEKNVLTNETPLISGGIIDSILTMQLVVFIEETYNFEFLPHEVDKENLNTIGSITAFIVKKING